jgi:hypothetical protein
MLIDEIENIFSRSIKIKTNRKKNKEQIQNK